MVKMVEMVKWSKWPTRGSGSGGGFARPSATKKRLFAAQPFGIRGLSRLGPARTDPARAGRIGPVPPGRTARVGRRTEKRPHARRPPVARGYLAGLPASGGPPEPFPAPALTVWPGARRGRIPATAGRAAPPRDASAPGLDALRRGMYYLILGVARWSLRMRV